MAYIDINLMEVSSVNAQLPRYLIKLTNVKRELEILKWKLSEELMQCGNMRERYVYIQRQISEVEEKLNEVHDFISSAVRQYEEVERIMQNRQADFL